MKIVTFIVTVMDPDDGDIHITMEPVAPAETIPTWAISALMAAAQEPDDMEVEVTMPIGDVLR